MVGGCLRHQKWRKRHFESPSIVVGRRRNGSLLILEELIVNEAGLKSDHLPACALNQKPRPQLAHYSTYNDVGFRAGTVRVEDQRRA